MYVYLAAAGLLWSLRGGVFRAARESGGELMNGRLMCSVDDPRQIGNRGRQRRRLRIRIPAINPPARIPSTMHFRRPFSVILLGQHGGVYSLPPVRV